MPTWVRLMEQWLQQNTNLNKDELMALITGVQEDLTHVQWDICQVKQELQDQITEVDNKVEVLSLRVINFEILAARVCCLVFCLSNF